MSERDASVTDVTGVTAHRREVDRLRQARLRARRRGQEVAHAPPVMGRPTLFTPEIVQQILTSLEIGNTGKDSALAAGIGESTFKAWCREKSDFRAQVERARAKARQRLVGFIVAAAPRDWRAGMALLAAMDPENWGHSVNIKLDVRKAIEALSDDPEEIEAAMVEAERIMGLR